MLLIIARILSALFAILVISKSFLSFKQGRESWVVMAFWTVTWLVILAISFYPQLVDEVLGEQPVGLGTLMGIGLIFLYFVLYRVYIKADRVERQLQTLIQDLSLKELRKKR